MEARRAQIIAAKLLEGPDDIDPRTALKSLPGKRWIISFAAVEGPDGVTYPSVECPINAITEDDAIELAKKEMIRAGYIMRNPVVLDAWVTSEEVFNDLKQIWLELGMGKNTVIRS